MRILVSGFEPFGGDAANASGDAVRELGATWSNPSVELHTVILPVSFDRAPEALAASIEAVRPDAVICVGEAGGRPLVTPERWAVNERRARIPDNDGAQPSGPIDDLVPRLPSRLDVDGIVRAVRAAGVAAEVSDDAGRYVCNATFRAALTCFDGPAGFLHVPAVRAAGTALVGSETDTPAVGGVAMDQMSIEEVVTALCATVWVVSLSVLSE
ncbi:pyroglutamyl-peptidase I [Tessaracoccus sp. MC1756]|uniref:pyroglutamyl-peptidase I n=1 Tax=Tessaracoccus sp. MC1756 TaxID=2760311 RepID=UPI001602C5C4|nr:pyroglutamyl-peptidase I [Tessaracoccus sp. MC1756]MBB1508703.1 pyroglutamyl-peptidase I [Tessaracoccus sp. MC1756]